MKKTLVVVPMLFALGCYYDFSGVADRPCPTDPADPLFDTPTGRACRALMDAGTDAAEGDAPGAAPGSSSQACSGDCIDNRFDISGDP